MSHQVRILFESEYEVLPGETVAITKTRSRNVHLASPLITPPCQPFFEVTIRLEDRLEDQRNLVWGGDFDAFGNYGYEGPVIRVVVRESVSVLDFISRKRAEKK